MRKAGRLSFYCITIFPLLIFISVFVAIFVLLTRSRGEKVALHLSEWGGVRRRERVPILFLRDVSFFCLVYVCVRLARFWKRQVRGASVFSFRLIWPNH